MTDALISEVNQGLDAAELIKVKFVDNKEKETKTALAREIARRTQSHLAGLIGHVAIYYREHREPEKRTITIP